MVLLVVMAFMHNTDDNPGNGGGACAIMGFGVLIIVLFGTWFERTGDKPARRSRRDDR